MSFVSTTILAFSMSADAFAASISSGVSIRRPKLRRAVNIGLVFAAAETISPLIGWLAGVAAHGFIEAYDHWVSFVILALVGGKMAVDGLIGARDGDRPDRKPGQLVLTAIGTSMDGMAVGVTLAFLDVSIAITALAIGLATFLMATAGVMTGRFIGESGGRITEIVGGLFLVLIGTHILLSHLGLIAPVF